MGVKKDGWVSPLRKTKEPSKNGANASAHLCQEAGRHLCGLDEKS